MTARVLADTHVFIWDVLGSPRLSESARAALDASTTAGQPILVSAASLVELQYLVEKGKFTEDEFVAFLDVLDNEVFEVAPVDLGVAREVARIPRELVADPFDRMIAATALARESALVTHDGRLQKLSAPRIVR